MKTMFSIAAGSFCLGLLLLVSPSYGLLEKTDTKAVLYQATHIVQGRVVQINTEWIDYNGIQLWSRVTIRVERQMKGEPVGSTLILMVRGGWVGGTYLEAEDIPRFDIGEELLLFLVGSSPEGTFKLINGYAGKLLVEQGKVMGGRIRVDDYVNAVLSDGPKALEELLHSIRRASAKVLAGTPQITGVSPSKRDGGRGLDVTITGENFGSQRGMGTVKFFGNIKSGGPGYYEPGGDYFSWSDTKIVCNVPIASSANDEYGWGVRVRNADGVESPDYLGFDVGFSVSPALE
ncbi:MAG TPA: hypothetical protein EYP17_12735, partial [Candidatus Latescibacteria bacterium]|nr:hypothetical protein [Candidatus Latescibacterota bacterium]